MFIAASIVDLCLTVDPQPYVSPVASCAWSALTANERVITCIDGYWATGPGQIEGDKDITIVGAQLFGGCIRMFCYFTFFQARKILTKYQSY